MHAGPSGREKPTRRECVKVGRQGAAQGLVRGMDWQANMTQSHDIVISERGGALGAAHYHEPHAPAPDSEASLAKALSERKWTVILVSLLCGVLAVPPVFLFMKPKYEVRSTVLVKSIVKPIMAVDGDTDISRNYQTYMATQRGIIMTPDLIASALESPKVKELGKLQWEGDAVRGVLSSMAVERMSTTELLGVALIGERPKELEVVLNSIIDVYLQRQEQEKRKEDERAIASLRKEQADLELRIGIHNESIKQIAVDAGIDAINLGQGGGLQNPATGYQAMLTDARKTRALAEGRLKELQSLIDDAQGQEGGVALPGYEEFAGLDRLLLDLKTQLRMKEQESLTDKQMGRGPTHPDVQTRPALIASFKEEITKRERELRDIHAGAEVRKLEAESRDAAIMERVTEQELAKTREENSGQARQAFVLLDKQHERTQLESTLAAVRNKIWQVEVEQNRIPRLSLNSPARAPTAPNLDKRLKFAALAAVGSIFVGVGVAFVRHRLDTRLRSPQQVQERLGVRVLGTVAQVPGKNGAVSATLDLAMREPSRSISTALLAGGGQKKTHSRLITSPTPGSGKSSMALNLARSLAATGRSVLLIDGDNQRQGLSRKVNLKDKPGLFEVLCGEKLGLEVLCNIDSPRLKCMPAGKRDAAFGERLTDRDAQTRLRDLCQAFDEVIVDSPPVLAMSDTLVLATLVDEVVLVLRANHSNRAEAEAAREYLSAVGCKISGAILNGVDPRRVKFGYGYGYGYGYDQDYQEAGA